MAQFVKGFALRAVVGCVTSEVSEERCCAGRHSPDYSTLRAGGYTSEERFSTDLRTFFGKVHMGRIRRSFLCDKPESGA